MITKSYNTTSSDRGFTIRRAVASDGTALIRLAELDSRPYAGGPALIAEADGVAVAALPLDGGDPLADPFVHTAAAVQLLELRAAQLGDDRTGVLPRMARRISTATPLARAS